MEITAQREDYLTCIFKLNQRYGKANNKEISNWLNIAPPSVTEMLKKLKKENLVSDNPSNIELTEKGEALAKLILSKHRLWEYFLTESLGFDWKDVHEQAKALQNVTGEELFNRLNDFLEKPKSCPHGGHIFFNLDTIDYKDAYVKLSNASCGKAYRLKKLSDNQKLLSYTEKLGLKLNSRIYLESVEDFDDSLVIRIGDKSFSISSKTASNIMVQEEIFETD